jgi:hypothetical protein
VTRLDLAVVAVIHDSLADDLLDLADRIDRAGAAAIADRETFSAMQHLAESIEAAERAIGRLMADDDRPVRRASGPS